MELIKTIENIRTFSLGNKLIYQTRDGKNVIDESEVDFESNNFHQIGNNIYSNSDYYLNENNDLVELSHLNGKSFTGSYFERIKLYKKRQSTIFYFYEDDNENPILEFDSSKLNEGSIRCFNKDVFIKISDDSILYAYSILTGTKKYEIDLGAILDDKPSTIELDAINITKDRICLSIHNQSYSHYGAYIFDSENGEQLYQEKNIWTPVIFNDLDEIITVCRKKSIIKKLNTHTFETSEIDFSDTLDNLVFETQTKPIIINNIIYVALLEQGTDHYNYWASVDLNNHCVIHIEEMLLQYKRSKKKTFVSKIDVGTNCVGVLIQGGILQIYKKNEKMPTTKGVTPYLVTG